MSEDYEVGYGKPPKAGQFKPGQSGNSKGRPKGAKDLKTDLLEELAEYVTLKEGGKTRRVTKQRAAIKTLVAKATHGDGRAVSQLINLSMKFAFDHVDDDETDELSLDDTALVEAFMARMNAMTKEDENDENT